MTRRSADADADALVERHAPWLFAWLRLRVGREEEAEELAQEVLLRLLERLPHIRSPQAVPAWLRATARDLLRRRRSRRTPGGLAAEPPARGGPPADQRLDRLAEAVRDLPEELSEVVLARYARDLTYQQVAAVLGTSRATVQSRLRRALARLRQRLGVLEGEKP